MSAATDYAAIQVDRLRALFPAGTPWAVLEGMVAGAYAEGHYDGISEALKIGTKKDEVSA